MLGVVFLVMLGGQVIAGATMSSVIITSSVVAEQGAFVTVHRRVYTVPRVPVKSEIGSEGSVTVPPAPEMIDHSPVPILGALPANPVVVEQMG